MAPPEKAPGASALPPHLRHIDPQHATTKKVVKEFIGDGPDSVADDLAEAKDISLLYKNFFAELDGPRCLLAKRDKDLLKSRLLALKDKDPARARELIKRERAGFAPLSRAPRLSDAVETHPHWEGPPSFFERIVFWFHRFFRRNHFEGGRLKSEVFSELERIHDAYALFAPGWSHVVDHMYNDEFFPPDVRGPRSPESYNLMALLSPDQMGQALDQALTVPDGASPEERVRSLDRFARIYLTLNHRGDRPRLITDTVKALANLLDHSETLREVSRRSCLLHPEEIRELAPSLKPFFHHTGEALPVVDLLTSCYAAHFKRAVKREDLEKMFRVDAPIESRIKVLGPSARGCYLADLGALTSRKREAEQAVAFWGEAKGWAAWGEVAWEALVPSTGLPTDSATHQARVKAFEAFWKPVALAPGVLRVLGSGAGTLAMFPDRKAEMGEYLSGIAMGDALLKAFLKPPGSENEGREPFPPGPDLPPRLKEHWPAFKAKAALYAWNLVEIFGHEILRLEDLDPGLTRTLVADPVLVDRLKYWYQLGEPVPGAHGQPVARPLVEMDRFGETVQYPPFSVFGLLQSGRCMALYLARELGYDACMDIPGNIKRAVAEVEATQQDLVFLGGSGAY